MLNNRGYLSDKTKRSVADAIEALGYRPNSLARALHGKSTQTVGLIVPAVSLPFSASSPSRSKTPWPTPGTAS